MWNPPRPGIKPMSPALVGRFYCTTKEVLDIILVCDIWTESNMILFLPSGASMISSLEKCLFDSLVHFESNCLILLLLLNCGGSLYILDINPL